jgi:hypothetical protein
MGHSREGSGENKTKTQTLNPIAPCLVFEVYHGNLMWAQEVLGSPIPVALQSPSLPPGLLLWLLSSYGFPQQTLHVPRMSDILGSPLQLELHPHSFTHTLSELAQGNPTLLHITWPHRLSSEIRVEATMSLQFLRSACLQN